MNTVTMTLKEKSLENIVEKGNRARHASASDPLWLLFILNVWPLVTFEFKLEALEGLNRSTGIYWPVNSV